MNRSSNPMPGNDSSGAQPTPMPWPCLTAQRTLILPVPRGEWALPPGACVIDGVVFLPRLTLHITLAGHDAIAAVEDTHGKAGAEAVLRDAYAACGWHYRRTRHFLRLRKPQPPEPDAGSIIELLDMPGLGDFYRVLAARGTALPVPPAHVTLWTHTRPQGIGVADEATLAGLCVREVAAHELGL